LIVPRISNFFYDSFISAVEEECRKNNYSLMVLQSGDDPETENNNVKLCRQNRVTGLFACITAATNDITAYEKLNELEIPVVFFDKVPEKEHCNKVCLADTEAAQLAAETILHKKKKNVLALFGDPHFSITKKRLQAFESVIHTERKKITYTPGTALNTEEAFLLVKKHLKQHPETDTIFCMSDEILTGVMKAVQQLGCTVPGDVGIIAMSNGFIPKLYFPEITYVETSGSKLGKLAFTRMLDCVEDYRSTAELTVASELVEGGSL
jgi:LacI family transcriptional regulator